MISYLRPLVPARVRAPLKKLLVQFGLMENPNTTNLIEKL